MTKTKKDLRRLQAMRDVVFREAIEPMEAAVIPAGKPGRTGARMGTLAMAPRAYEATERRNQRAKIWVR